MWSFAPADLRTTLLVPLLSTPDAEDAWGTFFSRFWPCIVQWARQRGVECDDAEEIGSEVLLKLSRGRALDLFDRAKGRFRPWLRRLVQRKASDFLKKRRRTPGSVGKGGEDQLAAVADPASLKALTDGLDSCFSSDFRMVEAVVQRVRDGIKTDTWEAYYRTAILGKDAVDTAGALGLSVGAVYMAKQRVRSMLIKEGQSAAR